MRTLWLMMVLVVVGGTLQAEEVRLKNGDVVSGEIVSMDAKSLKLKSENFGEITIVRDRIVIIRFGDLTPQQPWGGLYSPPPQLPPSSWSPNNVPTLHPSPSVPVPSIRPGPSSNSVPNFQRPEPTLPQLQRPDDPTSVEWRQRLKSTIEELSRKESESADASERKSLSDAKRYLIETMEAAEKRFSVILNDNFKTPSPAAPPPMVPPARSPSSP